VAKQRFRNEDLQRLGILPEPVSRDKKGKLINRGLPVVYSLLDQTDSKLPRYWKIAICEEHNAMGHIRREEGNTCRLDMGKFGRAKRVLAVPNVIQFIDYGVFRCSAPSYFSAYDAGYFKFGAK
jgi:hypothetical protein